VLLCALGCGGDGGLGPPDSYLVLAPAPGAATNRPGPPLVKPLAIDAPAAQPVVKLFAEGFASEMLRTAYLAKQLVRDGQPGGRPAPVEGRAIAAQGLPVIIGIERTPYGRGLFIERWLRDP